jgi:hypothetical protein
MKCKEGIMVITELREPSSGWRSGNGCSVKRLGKQMTAARRNVTENYYYYRENTARLIMWHGSNILERQ